jgi:REP element-mobilizing transposase RayT
MQEGRVYLFIHIITEVSHRAPLIKKSLRAVFYGWCMKFGEEKAIRFIRIGGSDDHMHYLIQLHPAQNLLQVVKQLKDESSKFIHETKLLQEEFTWKEDYTAYSVSPGSLQQTMEYIERQEEYHQSKSLEQEMELFNKTRITIDDAN